MITEDIMQQLKEVSSIKLGLRSIFNSLKEKRILILSFTRLEGDFPNYWKAAGILVDVCGGKKGCICSVSLKQDDDDSTFIVDIYETSEIYLLAE